MLALVALFSISHSGIAGSVAQTNTFSINDSVQADEENKKDGEDGEDGENGENGENGEEEPDCE